MNLVGHFARRLAERITIDIIIPLVGVTEPC